MRVLPAGAGAGFVDGAVVVLAEEGAGGYVEHVVAIVIEVEVIFDQFAGFYAEVAGQPVDVDVAEDGAGGFAAVGAFEAVYFLEDFVVKVMELLVEVFGRAGLELAEELLIALALVAGLFYGFFYVHGWGRIGIADLSGFRGSTRIGLTAKSGLSN
jgi:hypothetical protein